MVVLKEEEEEEISIHFFSSKNSKAFNLKKFSKKFDTNSNLIQCIITKTDYFYC